VYKGVVLKVDDHNGVTHVRVGNVTGIIRLNTMTWARKPNPKVSYYYAQIKKPSQALKAGDVIYLKVLEEMAGENKYEFALYQEPVAQSALLSIEAETGHVKAMIGGRDFRDSQFNRAVQSSRVPRSSPSCMRRLLTRGTRRPRPLLTRLWYMRTEYMTGFGNPTTMPINSTAPPCFVRP
jgi:penicillin-binding protein 1A